MDLKAVIYKITNIINNKVYIGQSRYPNKRWKQHQYLSNKVNNLNYKRQYIHKAIKKYGLQNFTFEIICSCIIHTKENIDQLENEIINQYNSRNQKYGYNIKSGGNTKNTWHHSEETKQKISNEWHLYRTPETFEKIKNAHIGRKCSQETKNKISAANKGNQFCLGEKQHQDTIEKRKRSLLLKSNFGERKCSIEGCKQTDVFRSKRYDGIKICKTHYSRLKFHGTTEKQKNIAHNKGKKLSEESRQKLSKALKGRSVHNKGKPMPEWLKQKLINLSIGREPYNKIKFTTEQIQKILIDTRPISVIAKEFGVSRGVIYRILRENKLNKVANI